MVIFQVVDCGYRIKEEFLKSRDLLITFFYFEVSSPPTTENSEILTLPADDIKSPPAGRKRRNAFVIGEIKRIWYFLN